MGNSCTKFKHEKVIQPLKTITEDPTQPESLSADAKKNFATETKSFNKPKTNLDSSIDAGCPPYQGSRNGLPSTDDCFEDTSRPCSKHCGSHNGYEDTSQFYGDPRMKRSAYYQKGPLIGKGPCGEVFECLNLHTGELVAVKEIKLHGDPHKIQPYIEAIKKENALFRTLFHSNIMKYYDIEITEEKMENQFVVGLAVEYVSGGSIRALLDKFHSLEEKVVMSYTRQILEGLSYLHQKGIVHKNLKGTNILIDASGTIKLADFGSFKFDSFSEESPRGNRIPTCVKNSLYWLAPEVVMKKAQGKPADVWSVGCLAIEMLTGVYPWKSLDRDLEETVKLISSGSPPPFPQDVSDQCRDFLYKVFKFKPEDRPTVADLLSHPFVKDTSPNNSYLESDTYHSSLFGRPTEIFRSNSSNERNSNIRDSRLQNLVGNLATSNLYPSRVVSRSNYQGDNYVPGIIKSYSTDFIPLSKSDIQEKDSEQVPVMHTSLKKVQEVSCEDEYTPSITDKQFFPSQSKFWAKKTLGREESAEDIEKKKAEMRRQFEEEMMRELNHTSIDQTKEIVEDSKENIQLEEDPTQQPDNQKLKVVPIQNALFVKTISSEFKDIETNHSKEIEVLPVEVEGSLDDEIERRFAEIRQNSSTNFWNWNKENQENEQYNIKNLSSVSKPSVGNSQEFEPQAFQQKVLRPRIINRPLRRHTEGIANAIKPLVHDDLKVPQEDVINEDITNVLDVTDNEGGIHKRDLPLRVEGVAYHGEPEHEEDEEAIGNGEKKVVLSENKEDFEQVKNSLSVQAVN